MSKKCFKCGEVKPLSEFYRHPQMGDGHLNKCKACTKADVRLHRRLHDSVREYDRARAKQPDRIAKSRANSQRWISKHPLAAKAHTTLHNAVRDGKIKKQPCAICSSTKFIHAHHRDYSKPLEVVWLCAQCHHRVHALFPETAAHEKKAA